MSTTCLETTVFDQYMYNSNSWFLEWKLQMSDDLFALLKEIGKEINLVWYKF